MDILSTTRGSRPQRAVVTGGAGFVGSHVVDRLLDEGWRVLVIDNLSTGQAKNVHQHAEFVRADIASPEAAAAFLRFEPTAVVHLAAQASVPVSVADPALDASTNILGGIAIAQAAIAANCEQFVYFNTGGALYGRPRYLPVDEAHPVEPLSPYGLAKWTLECYLRLMLPATMPLSVLRLSNVYGPRQNSACEAGVVSVFAANMAARQPVTIHGDGEQVRDFVYVGDVANACLRALETPKPVTVNISGSTGTTVNRLFELIARVTEYPLAPEYGPERAGDIKTSILDNTLASTELGWRPEVTLNDGLRRTVTALLAQ